MLRWVNGRDPRQYGLDFGLWTRAVVVELIEEEVQHSAVASPRWANCWPSWD